MFMNIFLGDDSTPTENTGTSKENSESTATSGSDDSSSVSNENDDNGSDNSKTTQTTSDNAGNPANDGSTDENSNVEEGSSGVIAAVVVVIILLLIGAGVGYWFVKGKQGGAGKAGSSPEPVQNQKYDQVPAEDIEAK